LPAPLARLLDDPVVLVEAAGSEPPTLLHGDPWPGNVLRPAPDRRVWVDWELASVGPAAADLASWLDQAPWYAAAAVVAGGSGPRYRDDAEIYLAARSRPVDRETFKAARDAAAVLWFLAYDVTHLAELPGTGGRRGSETVLTKALIAAERLLSA
jgi:thiamine kinase-like enzyme